MKNLEEMSTTELYEEQRLANGSLGTLERERDDIGRKHQRVKARLDYINRLLELMRK